MLTSAQNFTLYATSFREEEQTSNNFTTTIEDSIFECTNVFREYVYNKTYIAMNTDSILMIKNANVKYITINFIHSSILDYEDCIPTINTGTHDSSKDKESDPGINNMSAVRVTYNISTGENIQLAGTEDIFIESIILQSTSDEKTIITHNLLFQDVNADKYQPIKTYIPLTSYSSGISSISGTFNEKLSEKDNGNYSLTFSIQLFNNGHRNPLLEYIVNDRMMRLVQDETPIDFYITGRAPNFSSENVNYSITCQDAFSWLLSKQSPSINISTEDSEIWNETGPKTIYDLADKVLELASLKKTWQINYQLLTNKYLFPSNLYTYEGPLQCSLELTNTTPYNALIEISKLFNAIVTVDYSTVPYTINFVNKEKMTHRGVKLNPNVNLSQFGYSDKSDNLYSVMHITGGEDADGNYVSILPTMPGIVAEFLIMFSRRNVLDEEPEVSIDQPYYYVVRTDTGYNLYRKGASGSYIEETYIGTSVPTKGDEKLFWEDEETITGVYTNLINKMEKVSDALGLAYEQNKSDMMLYFKDLINIPHASSSFYDFEYYVENSLLSSNRASQLEKSLNIDLRNINLLLNSYTPLYYRLKYELDKSIDKEKEYVSLMAAEDEYMATYDMTSTSNGYLSLKGIYSANSKEFSYKDEQDNIYKKFTIPIGYSKDYSLLGTTMSVIYFGKSDKNSYITHYLPDFTLLQSLHNDNKLILVDENDVEQTIKSFDPNSETITTGMICEGLIYMVYYIEPHKDKSGSTIDAFDITGEITGAGSDLISVDKLGQRKIEDYMQNVASLWNDTYIYYYQTLYGKDWFNTKKKEILEMHKTYSTKRLSLETRLTSGFGSNWQNIDIDNLSHARLIEYSDLKEQLQKVGMYVGGKGTRSNYEYKGLYDYYLDCINAYLLNRADVTIKSEPLVDIIKDLNKQKNWWKSSFYSQYGDVIREVNYEDSTQLTPSGLYTAALKQFLQYNKPTASYNASYITMGDLVDAQEDVNIGEIIKIKQNMFNENIKTNWAKLTVNEDVQKNNLAILKYYDYEAASKQVGYTHSTAIVEISNIINRRQIIICDKEKTFNINNHIIKSITIGNNEYGYMSKRKIECVEKVYENKDLELRVTGVSKDLRSNVTQLTVEENTIYNTLVDRLLSLLK